MSETKKVYFIYRFFAFIIDLPFVLSILFILYTFLTIPTYISMSLAFLLYFSILESSKFQTTIGKKLANIIIKDKEGNKLSFSKALYRNSFKAIVPLFFYFYSTNTYNENEFLVVLTYNFIFLNLCYLFSPFKRNSQAIYDYLAGTYLGQKYSEQEDKIKKYKNTHIHLRERFSAFILDLSIILLGLFLINKVHIPSLELIITTDIDLYSFFIAFCAYYLISETFFDTTIGKYLLTLKIDFNKKDYTYKILASVIRNLPKILLLSALVFDSYIFILLFINYLVFYFAKQKTLFDLLSKTSVIRKYEHKNKLFYSELVIFILFISSILAISLPGYIPSKKIVLKNNASKLAKVLKEYKKANNNKYPLDISNLELDAKKNNYWQENINPITHRETKIYTIYSEKDLSLLEKENTHNYEKGSIIYFPNKKDLSTFSLYVIGENGTILKDSEKNYFIERD